jgi:hypothetical protein
MAELSSLADAPLSEGERLSRRAKIDALEEHMKGMAEGDQIAVGPMTSHLFASGVYARRMDIPAGVLVVGGLHRTEHLAILLKGKVRITTEEGAVELEAPQVMVAPPGTKRIAYAITDAAWISVHAVGEERDVEEIERRFIAPSHDVLLAEREALREIA